MLAVLLAVLATQSLALEILPVGDVPRPTAQQLKYGGRISALIHFGMATFFHDGDPGCTTQNWNGCDPKGACNSSEVSSFNPTNFNTTNWGVSFTALNISHAVYTAKHGCGFLGWQTNTTLPDGTPYRYHVPSHLPVARNFVETCKSLGIGYGFYYSLTNNFFLNTLTHKTRPCSTLLPGQACVTQQQYEDLAIAQLTELWTTFGPLTEVWLDGGVGDLGPRVAALLNRTYARDAVAFNGGGGVSQNPVRWCGTESGIPKGVPNVWSTATCGWCPSGSGAGSPPNVSGAEWYPSGVDVTLQQGDAWFYTPGRGLHSLKELIGFYHSSVGANGHLEIDFAIDRTGRVHPEHAARYAELGGWIARCYGRPEASTSMPRGSTVATLSLDDVLIDRVVYQEDQTEGQLIAAFRVEVQVGSTWTTVVQGQAVGAKRIDIFKVPLKARAVRFTVEAAFASQPSLLSFGAYAPANCII